MNRKQKKMSVLIVSIFCLLSAVATLVLYALKQNINLFYTPTELLRSHVDSHQTIRLGGYVKLHSVQYDTLGQVVIFKITDHKHELNVRYEGVLPNLFREGQTIVVTGKLINPTTLSASQVLAKHDEKYMPKALATQLSTRQLHGP